MGALWFSIFLMPLFQIGAAAGLLTLYFTNAPLAWWLFRLFWILSGIVYLVVTFVSYVVDPESAKRTWLEGILFPGLVALAVIFNSLLPFLTEPLLEFGQRTLGESGQRGVMVLLYSWPALSMLLAWIAKEVERRWRAARPLAIALLYLAGYGPFLSAVTFGAYIKELTGAEMKWDKTVKTGKVS